MGVWYESVGGQKVHGCGNLVPGSKLNGQPGYSFNSVQSLK